MGKTAKLGLTQKVLVLILTLAASAALVSLSGTAAYAAESGSASSGMLMAQSLTPGQIDAVPVNKASMYQVYSTYLDFDPTPAYKGGCVLYMEYRAKGSTKWKTSGWMNLRESNGYRIKGLKPNKTYVARLYYEPNANGLYLYNFTTRSGYSKTFTFKTGPKGKPAIKSVKVKAINVKKHKQHVFGYVIYWGSVNFYTYKVKTTVTFKKLPKTKFIWINGKKFKVKKGKKTYSVTSAKRSTYSYPTKNKWNVAVYGYRNATWGGYTGMYQKNFKIR